MAKQAQTPAQRAKAALKSLPSSIRVGPFDIAIHIWPEIEAHASARFAEFSATEQLMRISESLQSSHKVADSFLHELLHAVWWVNDLTEAAATEEHIVGHVASTLVQVHRDNPWLAPWIAEHTR